MKSSINRRKFLKYSASAIPVSALYLNGCNLFTNKAKSEKIVRIEVVNYKGPIKTAAHLEIESSSGIVGVFGTMLWGLPELMKELLPGLSEFLMDKDPLDRDLEFSTIWEKLYPNKPLDVYAKGIDPLTGKNIWGTTRGGRHSSTGKIIMALSAVDNALWDLRGKILDQRLCRIYA
jgi:L-alanine-DL-glutamate epimerase-like enolase superfamily enzyme